MDWSIVADLALGAAAFRMAWSADVATRELREVIKALANASESHQRELDGIKDRLEALEDISGTVPIAGHPGP